MPKDRPVKVSILMSVHNEGEEIDEAVKELLQVTYPCDIELIVVDDRTADGASMKVAGIDDPRVIVHRHPANIGKNSSLIFAASLASGSYILPFDSDLAYSPEDIPCMLEPVLKGRSSVVYGVRLFGYNTVYRSYRHAVGNRLLTRAANILFDASLTDMHTRLKLIPLSMLKSINLRQTGFGLDTELTASLLRCGIRPFEVPVSYYSRLHVKENRITSRHAILCFLILLRVRFRFRSSLGVPRGSLLDFDDHCEALPERPQLSSSGTEHHERASQSSRRDR
jgi:glycosyltransferase involved in cell wall biosynthesis